jgi:aromatic-L-amino-acid/L-tryptophan decarboxylase
MIVENTPTGVNGPLDLDAERMRSLGYRAVDALVERWAALEETPPWVGAARAELESDPGSGWTAPEEGEGPEAVLEAALARILPVAARVDHPRFLAYVPSAPTWPSVLADFLAAGFNTFQGTWQGAAAPGLAELEVLEWFRQWVGMPSGSSGLFTSGGSAANLLAVVAAREAAASREAAAAMDAGDPDGGEAHRARERPWRPAVYLSDQGHSSLLRAARIAGIPPEGIRMLPTGPDLRLDAATLRAAVEADRRAGWTPILVAANGGATSTGIVDPLDDLADACAELGVHYHVDAAYGGFAVLDPEGARELRGLGRADSITLDPHKWLFQPFECGCLLVRDPQLLARAFRVTPEYLQDTLRGDEEVNFSERGLQLTRSFRALKVWMSVRSFGVGAFREAVTVGLELARVAEARIRASGELELVTPASLGIVVWQARGPGDPAPLHRRIQEVLREEGVAFLSSTRIRGRHALRLCILNPRLRASDVEAIIAAAEAVVRTTPNP